MGSGRSEGQGGSLSEVGAEALAVVDGRRAIRKRARLHGTFARLPEVSALKASATMRVFAIYLRNCYKPSSS